MANNIVLLPAGADAADQIALTAVANSITWAPTQYGQQGSAVYTGSITNGAANALRGIAFTVTGFTNASNNGTFLCQSSTATTMTLNNARAVAETHAAVANYGTQGFPSQWSSKIANMYSNNQGDNISVELNGGETLIAIALGLRSFDPFDLLHGSAPYPVLNGDGNEVPFGFTQGLNDFNANPVISDHSSVTPISPVTLELGVASQFAILGASTVTNSGSSVVTGGDLGLYPGTSVTGFPPGVLTPPATEQIDTPLAIQAQAAASAAFSFYQAMTTTQAITTADLGTQSGGGAPTGHYYAGKYTSPSSIALTTSITLDAQGNPNAVFVFYATASTITQAAAAVVNLINGAQAANVVWLAGSSFTSVGAAASVGTLLAEASVTLGGGTLNGRAIALTAAVTISTATTITNESGAGGAGNNWQLIANLNLIDSDYTVSAVPPVPNTTPYPDYTKIALPGGGYLYIQIPPSYSYNAANQWPSSKWNLDGYYPSIYIWVATGALAGTYNINLNSVFQNGIIAPQDLAAGRAIFDGGVNFQVFKLQGTGVPEVSYSIGTSTANPATAPAAISTTAADGSALFSVALQKSGNVFAPGNVGAASPTSLTLTQVTPLIYGNQSGQYSIREGGAVYTGTITGGANNAFVGYTFIVSGFVAEGGANNGTFVCTASTGTTLTLSNGVAVNETHAGAASYQNLMTEISNGTLVGSEAHYQVEYALTAPGSAGSFNPGFSNPLGYEMVVASFAIKSS
jgi:hypothetical protein